MHGGDWEGDKLCDWKVYVVKCVTIDYFGVRMEAIYEIMSYLLAVSSITTWVSRGTVSSLISVLSTWTPPTSQRGQTWAASMSLLHSLRECNIEYPFNESNLSLTAFLGGSCLISDLWYNCFTFDNVQLKCLTKLYNRNCCE